VFILELSYIRPLDEVDRVRDEHMAWVATQYAAGRFLASGAKIPRTGGVVLAKAMPREELEDLIASDPFVGAGVVAYSVIEFAATTVADGLEALRESPAP
jgi:uncharacterized protein YciI